MAEINERIKEMRKRKNLTLVEVAEHLGVKEATAQRYESGNIKNIKHDTIWKLAELFDCDPMYLMGWGGDKPGTYNSSRITDDKKALPYIQDMTEGETMLVEMFRRLPAGAQDMYLEVLRAALKNQL